MSHTLDMVMTTPGIYLKTMNFGLWTQYVSRLLLTPIKIKDNPKEGVRNILLTQALWVSWSAAPIAIHLWHSGSVISLNSRLLTNFLCLPDRLICLSRIDQAERCAWYQACLILIRQQPDRSGCRLILTWHAPDRSGSCLILIRQQPDRSGCRLILIWHVPDRSGIAWYQAGKWCLICLSRIFDPAPKIRRSGNLAWYVKNLRLA